jgi:hypothetical protein
MRAKLLDRARERFVLKGAERRATFLAGGLRIELGTERESLLQVLDEDAHFRGDPAAGRTNGHDWNGSLQGSQQTQNSAFPQLGGEQPCWRLCNPEMFEDAHPHLFDIAGPKNSRGDDALGAFSGPDTPRLGGPTLDKNNCWKAAEIFW